ncbi:MAG: cysteine synthase family protein [Propionibacteriaceae bacterium]|jgi:cystathionine beta-synthase/cysteine synthase A|nr:cysteine synthase family protein [Propionibacteriaceae bacterium]
MDALHCSSHQPGPDLPGDDILSSVGNTGIVYLRNMPVRARMAVKLEFANPGGSLKDRSALHIVNWAEATGRLKPGGTLIESSSGNFGIALAMIGAARGYKTVAVVDPKLTSANRALLEAYGAQVVTVNEPDETGSYHKPRIALANQISIETEGSFRPDQCFNLLNGEAHYRHTGPELLRQVGDSLAAVVCSVSTGGQLGGISRYFRDNAPEVRVIGVDVVGSSIFGGEPKAYLTPGVGLSWTPDNLYDLGAIDRVYQVTDEGAFSSCRVLAQREGILCGPSTGSTFLVATALAAELAPDQVVAILGSDRGERYLQSAYDDAWMRSHGLSTSTSIEDHLLRTKSVRLVSTAPEEDCANFQDGLAEKLGSPTPPQLRKIARVA